MKGLLLKDYYVLNDTLFIQLVMLSAIGAAISFVISPLVFIVISTTTFGMFSSTCIVSGKTSKWDMFAATIPISKEKVIAGKYVFNTLLVAIGLLLGILITLITSAFFGSFDFAQLLQYIFVALTISLSSSGVSIPLSV